MKQDIKTTPAKEDPKLDIFGRLMNSVLINPSASRIPHSQGAGWTKRGFDPVRRKTRNRMARLSRRKNRR